MRTEESAMKRADMGNALVYAIVIGLAIIIGIISLIAKYYKVILWTLFGVLAVSGIIVAVVESEKKKNK